MKQSAGSPDSSLKAAPLAQSALRRPHPWRMVVICGLISIPVFRRHIVLRELSGVNFSHVRVRRILYSADCFGFKELSLFEQFFDAFRARFRGIR